MNTDRILEVRISESGDVVRIHMAKIHLAESRLGEVRHTTNHAIAADLKAVFNDAWSDCSRYLAGLHSEEAKADRQLRLAKAEAILDKYPEFLKEWAKKNPDMKVKDNADIRDSFIYRDGEFQKWKVIKDHITSVIALLEAKSKTFERAYWDCKSNLEEQVRIQGTRNFNAGVAQDTQIYDPSLPIGVSKL